LTDFAVNLSCTVYAWVLKITNSKFAQLELLIQKGLGSVSRIADPHRGFAFIEFDDPSDAQDAIDNMNLSEMFGKTLRVNLAKPGVVSGQTPFNMKAGNNLLFESIIYFFAQVWSHGGTGALWRILYSCLIFDSYIRRVLFM
jgi:hypothetical protein